MCIRDSITPDVAIEIDQDAVGTGEGIEQFGQRIVRLNLDGVCLLYTSDAADERSSVDLGGRRIIKKKNR